MQTLLNIMDDFRALDDLLLEINGDISDPRVDEIVTGFLDELGGNLERKVDGYAAFITELLSRAEVREKEAERLANRVRIDRNTASFLKDRLKNALAMRGIDKLETDRYRVSIAKNGGKQPVQIPDPLAIPAEFTRTIPARTEPDVDLVRDALVSGAEVPGAILLERGTHLRIR